MSERQMFLKGRFYIFLQLIQAGRSRRPLIFATFAAICVSDYVVGATTPETA